MVIHLNEEGMLVYRAASLLTDIFGMRHGSELNMQVKLNGGPPKVEVHGTKDVQETWKRCRELQDHPIWLEGTLKIPSNEVRHFIKPDYGKQDADSMIFLKHFDMPKGSKVLEVGANEEALACILTDNEYEVTGIDLRPHYFQLPHRYNRIEGDFLKIAPLFKGEFDAVYSTSAIEHFGLCAYGRKEKRDHQDMEAMWWMFHLLKPGGRCYITVPYGKAFTEYPDWRIYDEQAIRERIVQQFRIEKMLFFKSGVCGCPSENGIVTKEDADAYAGVNPHVTTFLELIKS